MRRNGLAFQSSGRTAQNIACWKPCLGGISIFIVYNVLRFVNAKM
uniref:Uncharacterized protein n=1 Tax=Siphoviridae sp. ctKNZ79 TaxID=2825440 RepID=A0A8S5U9G0_9CAUD|nr:MAG TPA: hypothetical protein [Siphoviridae sp. ctKNZ79]